MAKLYGSEMGWRVVDELMQVCGGRGYETARSLQARGLRGVPVEQVLRDMRVNRIFEGSTEIMHLIIAREALDQHIHVAGDLMEPDLSIDRKAKALGRVGAFYATWYPKLAVGRGQAPQSYAGYGELAGQMRFVERASRKLARSTFYGMARWQAGTEAARCVPGSDRGHRSRAVRDLRDRGLHPDPDERSSRARRRNPGPGRGLLQPGPAPHRAVVPRAVEQRRRRPTTASRWTSSAAGTPGWRRASSTRPPATARWSHRSKPTAEFRSPATATTAGAGSLADRAREITSVAVVGGGFMGTGIAETAAVAGISVVVRELPEYLDGARRRLESSLDRAVKRGKTHAADRDSALARITLTSELNDVAGADLVIEAVPEDVELKTSVIKALGDIVADEAVIASNTSVHPDRAAGERGAQPRPCGRACTSSPPCR